MNYLVARYTKERVTETFMNYVADGIWLSANGKMFQTKYSELVNGNNDIDNRTGDDIVLDVFAKCGLSFKEE